MPGWIELVGAALLGGLVTMAITSLTLGKSVTAIKDTAERTAKELAQCREMHSDCPDHLVIRFTAAVEQQVSGLEKQLTLVSESLEKRLELVSQGLNERLRRIENHIEANDRTARARGGA